MKFSYFPYSISMFYVGKPCLDDGITFLMNQNSVKGLSFFVEMKKEGYM